MQQGTWAVVVADGDVDAHDLERALAMAGGTPLILAADGGARRAIGLGVTPSLVVGDGDSLDEATRGNLAAAGVPVRAAPVDKDESDTELCLVAAVEAGARHLRIVGALGGARPEHAVANLLLLAHPLLDGLDVAIVTATSELRRMGMADGPGELRLSGAAGDLISLLALESRVEGVRTEGLRYPLHGEALVPGPARGLSNELLSDRARITTGRGRLLVVHTHPPTREDPR